MVILAAAREKGHGTALAPVDIDQGEGERLCYEGGAAFVETEITPV